MQFNSTAFNTTPFNAASGASGYDDKPAIPTGVAVSGEVYTLVLTGANDGVDDVTLPVVNINLRWTNGGIAWVSCTVPNGLDYVDGVSARPNGEIALLVGERWSNGWIVIRETVRAPMSITRLDEGSQSNSYTLQGYSDMTTGAKNLITTNIPNIKIWGSLPKARPPETIAVQGITFRRGAVGAKEIRAKVDTGIRPGDTVSSATDSFVVRSIQWFIGETSREILLSE